MHHQGVARVHMCIVLGVVAVVIRACMIKPMDSIKLMDSLAEPVSRDCLDCTKGCMYPNSCSSV